MIKNSMSAQILQFLDSCGSAGCPLAPLSPRQGHFSAEVAPSRISCGRIPLCFRPADADEPRRHSACTGFFFFFLLGKASLGWISRAGGGAKTSPAASPALTKHKVIVGGGAHGVKYVGFVGNLEF